MLAPVTYTALAPAKINLYLHITGKRDDGYHLLESLVVFADFGDRITVQASQDITLNIQGEYAVAAGQGADNIVMRTAQLLQEKLGEDKGASIALDKHIPVGAGLGGGSSDAAVAASLLCKLWGHIVPKDTLCEWLLPLGADIAACVHQQPLIMSGIGERITEMPPLPPLYILLVNPNASVPTEQVYKHYTLESVNQASMASWEKNISSEDFLALLQPTRNHLQRAAIAVSHEVAEVLIALETQPNTSLVRMSGSGATCFALFHNPLHMQQVAEDMRHMYPHWWVQETQLLGM